MKKNILYFYEDRIPSNIRKLVISEIKKKNFFLRKISYSNSEKKIKKYMSWADGVFFCTRNS